MGRATASYFRVCKGIKKNKCFFAYVRACKKKMVPKAIICPSLLAADLSALAADSATMIECGADWLQ